MTDSHTSDVVQCMADVGEGGVRAKSKDGR